MSWRKLIPSVTLACRQFTQKSDMTKAFTALTMSHVNILKTSGGRCVAEFTVSPSDTNFFGTMHGGMTATLVDEISTVALMSNSNVKTGGVSVNLSVSYMSAAKLGETLVVDAETAKCGKTLAFLNVSITEKQSKRLIAQGCHTKYVGEAVQPKL